MEKAISPDEVQRALLSSPTLASWRLVDGAIEKSYSFSDWKATMMAANAVAQVCESANHHPDLLLSYSKMTVRLNTHDVKGISLRDFETARRIETALNASALV
jgi:4a-hydroxytetrahydrobiopterin dehydratase